MSTVADFHQQAAAYSYDAQLDSIVPQQQQQQQQQQAPPQAPPQHQDEMQQTDSARSSIIRQQQPVRYHNDTSQQASRQTSERQLHHSHHSTHSNTGSLRRTSIPLAPSTDNTINSVTSSRMDASIRAPLNSQYPTSSPQSSIGAASFVAPNHGETSTVPQMTLGQTAPRQTMQTWQQPGASGKQFDVTTANTDVPVGLQAGAAVTTPMLPLQKASSVLAMFFAAGITGLILYQILEYRRGFTFFGARAFNMHALLMTAGFTLFATPAVLVKRFMPANWRHSERVSNWIITLCHLATLACIGLGTWGATEALTSPWLVSVHSWIGCGAALAFIIEVVISAIVRLMPSTSTRGAEFGSWLAFNGLATYSLGLMALATGIQEWATLLQTGNSNFLPGLRETGGLIGGPGNGQPINLTGIESRLLAGMGAGALLLLGTTLYAAMPRLAIINKQQVSQAAPLTLEQQQRQMLAEKESQHLQYNAAGVRHASVSNVRQLAQHSSSYHGSSASTRQQSRMPSMLGQIDSIA